MNQPNHDEDEAEKSTENSKEMENVESDQDKDNSEETEPIYMEETGENWEDAACGKSSPSNSMTIDDFENKHEVLKRSGIKNQVEFISEIIYEGSGGQGCVNRIFAKINDDGNWLLRWDVQNQKEDDFIALCYQG
ncbi:hypothetical protein WA026_012020 [Henosepilachna vigintioctopunctata]|uniref:Uncharacterized protein n=1 Tax=Henosepilachna vigintioctopunctata TaxID=420089 RepID=A0AAW1V6D4_9CUCU